MDAGVTFFMGIDPGKTGGIAVSDHLGIHVATYKMPETPLDLLALFGLYRHGTCRAVLENVHAGAWGHGKTGQKMGVTSAFTFGRGFGRLETALAAAAIPFDLVTPQTWQAAMGCRSGGDKNITKARAQQLFPAVTVTHAIADALLLAEYCRRYWRVGDPRKGQTNGKEGSQSAGAEKAHGEGDGEEIDAAIKYALETAKRCEGIAGASRAAAPGHRANPKRRSR